MNERYEQILFCDFVNVTRFFTICIGIIAEIFQLELKSSKIFKINMLKYQWIHRSFILYSARFGFSLRLISNFHFLVPCIVAQNWDNCLVFGAGRQWNYFRSDTILHCVRYIQYILCVQHMREIYIVYTKYNTHTYINVCTKVPYHFCNLLIRAQQRQVARSEIYTYFRVYV